MLKSEIVKLTVAWIGKNKDHAIQELSEKYLARLAHYVVVDGICLKDESKLLALRAQFVRPILIALDSGGKQYSSEEFAGFLREHQERGSSHLLFAVGPADGFSDKILKSADATISLGKLTLPHELARVVLLEQLYRGFTILKGHPYHVGH